MTLAYHRYHGLDTRIVRIFNTYGPRMRLRDGRAVPAFMSQALRGEDVTIFGDGTQTRSFCYVSDLVDGILRLMAATTNEPVNIGNPHEVTIEEIARTIVRLVDSKSRLVYRDLPVDDPKQRRPDITRARTLLGWEPKVGLEEGPAQHRRLLPQQARLASGLWGASFALGLPRWLRPRPWRRRLSDVPRRLAGLVRRRRGR